jgi:hypothetical protein
MADAPRRTLSPELEARLTQAEAAARHNDFDATGWLWMIVLGVVLPAALILAGWLYGPSTH